MGKHTLKMINYKSISKRLKIIIFDGSFKTTPFINRLIIGLSQKHNVYVLGFNETLPLIISNVNYVSLGSNSNKIGFAITSLKYPLRLGQWKIMLGTFRMLGKGNRTELQKQNLKLALEHIQPDIIHLQWPSVIPWFESVLKEQQIPVILSQRGYHVNVRPFVNSQNFKYLQKWFSKISAFHSVSQAISTKGDLIYNSQAKIDHVIYTGVSLKEFEFSKEYKKEDNLNIISVGRSHWKKGFDYALKACKLLKDHGLVFSYTIVGGTKLEELIYLINDLGLQEHVTLKDKLNQHETLDAIRRAAVFLLPSIEEGIANVAVEAMALGIPIISTDCGGMLELITNEKEGWVVATREPEALADAIMKFYEMPIENIQRIRAAARLKIENQHSNDQMAKGMEELYKEVLDRSKITHKFTYDN